MSLFHCGIKRQTSHIMGGGHRRPRPSPTPEDPIYTTTEEPQITAPNAGKAVPQFAWSRNKRDACVVLKSQASMVWRWALLLSRVRMEM